MFVRVFVWLELMALLFGAFACEKQRTGSPLPAHAFQFPTGIAIHPDGFALVASSNFDLTYQSGSLRVVDLNTLATRISTPNYDLNSDNSDLILDDQAISLDNFAGEVAISPKGDLAAVSIRETNQLILVDLKVNEQGSLELSCFDSPRKSDEKFPFCTSNRNIVQLDQNALQFDPFSIVLLSQQSTEDTLAYISFLASGTLSRVDIPDRSTSSLPIASLGPATGEAGLNGLAYSSASKYIYFSSRILNTTTGSNPIFFYDAFSTDAADFGSLDLYPFLLGSEILGLEFTEDGNTLALVVLNPNMLLFLDTSNGNNYLGSVALGKNPELVHRNRHGIPNKEGILNRDLFFVTCAQENTVYIIDGTTRRLLQVREDICGGPFDMDFFDRDSDKIHWALFSCFEDDSVTVLDVDPSSTTYLKVLAHVGKHNS